MEVVKITVTDIGGTYRDVADAARTTIGLKEGKKEISESYMYKMYKCEHSPIRLREFKIVIENCPSWVATHFVRHHIGVEKFVSTQRTDRTGIDRNKLPQDAPVRLQMNCNAQAIINIALMTGNIGRVNSKSTGIGLYLCKKLCDKLGLLIDIESEINCYTKVSITFPIGSFIMKTSVVK